MIKVINRNIKFGASERKEASLYKCQYDDKTLFKKLQINISYESEYRTYEIESLYLTSSKSIHFEAKKKGESFDIEWKPKAIVPYIKRIK